jgi:hypothetical protein
MIVAIQLSEPTFLSLSEWLITPFRVHQPSPMQQLLSCVACLPSLLYKARRLEDGGLDAESTASSPQEVWNSLFLLILALKSWVQSLETELDGPLYWTRNDACCGSVREHLESSNDPFPPLWFPNVWIANAMTHLWTFEVIIITKMKVLETAFAESLKYSDRSNYIPQDDVIELSTLICRSMQYLIQDSMKLYGPASTSLPLWTAKSAFKAAESRCQNHLN